MTEEFYIVCVPGKDIKAGPYNTYNEALKEAETLTVHEELPAYIAIAFKKIEQKTSFVHTSLTH